MFINVAYLRICYHKFLSNWCLRLGITSRITCCWVQCAQCEECSCGWSGRAGAVCEFGECTGGVGVCCWGGNAHSPQLPSGFISSDISRLSQRQAPRRLPDCCLLEHCLDCLDWAGHWVPWTGWNLGVGWQLPTWVGEGKEMSVGVQECALLVGWRQCGGVWWASGSYGLLWRQLPPLWMSSQRTSAL